MGVKDYDLNPDNNTQINGINIAEGCPPSGINNAVRQLMADVKADSDAQNTKAETPASAENLGPVKVGDGLTMGEDGTLSANLATAEAAGRVKASVAALAGAVPVGGADGSLDESWFKADVGDYKASCKTSKPGWLLCNGAAVSRTTYKDLFAVIGTNFGAGDGSTTFNLPDFRDKTFWGANGNLMQVIEAGLPDIKASWEGGASRGPIYEGDTYTGAFYKGSKDQGSTFPGSAGLHGWPLNFRASKSNPVYGNSTTVQPPAIGVNIFIKY